MTGRSFFLLAGTTAVLWIVPSIGTQGMGTIGQRTAHPDAILLDRSPADRTAAPTVLAQADRTVETTLGF